jgi:hypothetical protein
MAIFVVSLTIITFRVSTMGKIRIATATPEQTAGDILELHIFFVYKNIYKTNGSKGQQKS